MKIILSGGGTGGHIYPAVAVAEALTRQLGKHSEENPGGVEVLFVGALGKMEMEKIPALGYRIVGLPTAGLNRRLDWRNILLPFKIWRSLRLARRVVRDFGADVVVGFGGYASAPVLRAAQRLGVPTLIQEQNSYAGLANKLLARRAGVVCVAYEGMERFFPAAKIVRTGNPLRGSFVPSQESADAGEKLGDETIRQLDNEAIRQLGDELTRRRSYAAQKLRGVNVGSPHPPEGGADGLQTQAEKLISKSEARLAALRYFGFTADKPVLLVVGGSLGSRTFNEMMKRWVGELVEGGRVQVIWQTGKFYAAEIDAFMSQESRVRSQESATQRPADATQFSAPPTPEGVPNELQSNSRLWRGAFIERMDLAYAAADLVVSRSGAGTVSELALLGKAALFVPSPNVAEDHQTANAMALVDHHAAAICPDNRAVEHAIPMALELLASPEKLVSLSENIRAFATPDAADRVAEIICRLKI